MFINNLYINIYSIYFLQTKKIKNNIEGILEKR